MSARHIAPWLWLLLGLFCFRVLAQLLEARWNLPFLPAFEAWHSALLPYGLLLLAQALIIALCAKVALGFSNGSARPSRRVGAVCLSIGGLYLAVMLARLALGLFVLPSHPWFGAHLPTLFHLVLACFLLLVGAFHWSNVGRADLTRECGRGDRRAGKRGVRSARG